MPITKMNRDGGGMKPMSGQGGSSPMAESEGMGEDMAEGGEESSEAEVTTDIAILAGKEVEPGDRVTLEVVSVDPDMGSVVLRYPKEESKPPGIDAMADTFNQPPEEQA